MTTYTWTGNSGDNWNTANDWGTGNPAPGSTDSAILDTTASGTDSSFTIVINSDVTVNTITWKTPVNSATIDIAAGGYLTVNHLTGIASNDTIELDDFNASGSTLQIGTGGPISINTTPQSVLFLNDGSFGETVYWDSTSNLTSSKINLVDFISDDTLQVATSGTVTNLGTTYSNGTLTVTGTLTSGPLSGNTISASVLISDSESGPLTSADFFASYNSASGDIVITTDATPCFLRGTRIATLRGEVAVEDLRIGDLVVTTGGALPVKWIGTRGFVTSMVNAHHRAALLPIRIAPGALGEASPVRDLHVSPEHMLCLDDVLIPAEKLLNGTSISRAENFDVVQYFHIELPRHAVLYAEGAPAESFLDTGNRNMFANVLSYLELGHDLAAPPQPACLPIVTGGAVLDAVRARLAARAAGAGMATTEDDGLHLLVDGAVLRPDQRDGETVRFTVPAGARQVRIVSRGVVPADLDPANGDRRRLGICLAGLSLRDGSFSLDLAPGHAGLAGGFHAAEGGHRWTDGDAKLPEDMVAAMPDGFVLELKLVQTALRYALPAPAEVIPFVRRRTAARLTERLSA